MATNPLLHHLREGSEICAHPDESFLVVKNDERFLVCQECRKYYSIAHLFQVTYLAHRSLKLAQLYAEWQRDYDVPTLLDAGLLSHRIPSKEIKTRYSTLLKGSVLLDILLAPFTPNTVPNSVGRQFFQDSLSTALKEDSADPLLQTAFQFLRKMVAVESKRYADTLVPYVKGMHGEPPTRDIVLKKREDLYEGLNDQMCYLRYIHETYSRYSAAFDAIHVATLCFLCQDDPDSVRTLVYDFVGKMCRGYYAETRWVPRHFKSFLDEHLPDNPRLLNFLQDIRTGQFSESLLNTYWELRSKMLDELNHPPFFEWIFPRMFFDDYAEYYAFLVALATYSSLSVSRLTPPTHVLEDCERKYRFAKKCFSKFKRFHDCMIEAQLQERKETGLIRDEYKRLKKYYWTPTMVKRFLDPDFEKELTDHLLKELTLEPNSKQVSPEMNPSISNMSSLRENCFEVEEE